MSPDNEVRLTRRGFLGATGLAVGSLLVAGAPIHADGSKSFAAAQCGCDGDGLVAPTPLPTVPKVNTLVSRFSRSGKVGVGVGIVPVTEDRIPVLWRVVSGTLKLFQLDPWDGTNPALAVAVNDMGTCVGQSNGKPVLWTSDGSAKPLPLDGARVGIATAVSNGGQAIGAVATTGKARACLWSGNQLTELTAPGAHVCAARGVNAAGLVCGAAQQDMWYPMVWDGGTASALPVPRAYRGGFAKFITDDGIVVGEVYRRRSRRARAAMWVDGRCVPVGPRSGSSSGMGITDDGRVVGTFVSRDGRKRSFAAGETQWVELGAAAGFAAAKTVTASGTVTGNSFLSGLAIPVKWAVPALA